MSRDSVCISSAVYHYTALASLDTILTKDGVKLWATRYGFLNDKREFVWANQVIQPELKKIAEQNGEVFDSEHRVHPYTVSFAELENDMTMWRLYGNDGKGVCLSFDINEMDIRPENSMAHMAVVYTDEKNIRETIELAHRIYQQEYANERIADNYREIATFIKHKDYEAEKEYRVVKFVYDGFSIDGATGLIKDYDEFSDEVEFRKRGDTLVPYIELTFPKASLRRIYIGYDCNYESVKQSIELLTNLRGYDVEITKPSINNY